MNNQNNNLEEEFREFFYLPKASKFDPDENGHFDKFGGRYVPETLMPALLELEKEYKKIVGKKRKLRDRDDALFALQPMDAGYTFRKGLKEKG